MNKIPLEADIQKAILKYLTSRKDCWFYKAHSGSSFSKKGVPDIIGHCRGLFIGFEVKRPEIGVVSKIQESTIGKINNSGGKAYIVTSVEQVQQILDRLE